MDDITPNPNAALITSYQRTFVNDPDGAKVLEDLVKRFYDVDVFVKGGAEGARETDYKAGARAAVGYILKRLGQVTE